MESTNLNGIEAGILEQFGIRVRKKNGVFINSNGYKTVKTDRKNIKPLSDKIICVHTLIAWLKNNQQTIEQSREEYSNNSLETHHKNGNKLDNHPCNIIGFLTRVEHNKLNYFLSVKQDFEVI